MNKYKMIKHICYKCKEKMKEEKGYMLWVVSPSIIRRVCSKCSKQIEKKQKQNILNRNNINNAQHPSRQKAIHILENIEEKLGIEINEVKWYELEDMVTYMIEGARF